MAREKLTERLHIMLGKEQRTLLQREADACGWPLGMYIREAAMRQAARDAVGRLTLGLPPESSGS